MADIEKPKRRSKKQDAPVTEAPKTQEAKPQKRPKNYIEQDGPLMMLVGAAVTLRAMTPEQQAKAGIKNIEGKVGVPCTEPVKLTFKSAKAAVKFFNDQLHEEDEDVTHIVASSKVDWLSDNLKFMI